MAQLLSKYIPEDIIYNHIIPYTYLPQLAALQNEQGQLQGQSRSGAGGEGGTTINNINGGDSPTTNVGLKGNTRNPVVVESHTGVPA